MTNKLHTLDPLSRYTHAAQDASARIIGAYSTSFGAATSLLGARHRAHIRNIYALVRIADEIVDGMGTAAGLSAEEQLVAINQLEEDTSHAVRTGYSSNPIIHAFAYTARLSGIDEELTHPFFNAMRTDLELAHSPSHVSLEGAELRLKSFDASEHANYVYGSAEVIGLMCLRVFIRDETPSSEEMEILVRGARLLGAAFQNVNFLRDLADDTDRLGRSYLSERGRINESMKTQWVAEIRLELDEARKAIPLLPRDARVAVATALALFARLTERVAHVPVDVLYQRRMTVPTSEKFWLIIRSMIGTTKGRFA